MARCGEAWPFARWRQEPVHGRRVGPALGARPRREGVLSLCAPGVVLDGVPLWVVPGGLCAQGGCACRVGVPLVGVPGSGCLGVLLGLLVVGFVGLWFVVPFGCWWLCLCGGWLGHALSEAWCRHGAVFGAWFLSCGCVVLLPCALWLRRAFQLNCALFSGNVRMIMSSSCVTVSLVSVHLQVLVGWVSDPWVFSVWDVLLDIFLA